MLTTLLASSAPRGRPAGTLAMSALVHAALIGTGVFFTARGSVPAEQPSAIALLFQPPPHEFPPPAGPSIVSAGATLPAIVAPAVIPPDLPLVEARIPVDYERLFAFPGPAQAPASSANTRAPTPGVLDADAVDRPVRLAGVQVVPRYPDGLRLMGVEGKVVARFVVDTLGRVETASVDLAEASHLLFADAVRAALARLRFVPAESGGLRVRQLVVQQFVFSLAR